MQTDFAVFKRYEIVSAFNESAGERDTKKRSKKNKNGVAMVPFLLQMGYVHTFVRG